MSSQIFLEISEIFVLCWGPEPGFLCTQQLLQSTALAMVWITQLWLERICRAGLPSQGICGVLKQILVFPSVVWQQVCWGQQLCLSDQ